MLLGLGPLNPTGAARVIFIRILYPGGEAKYFSFHVQNHVRHAQNSYTRYLKPKIAFKAKTSHMHISITVTHLRVHFHKSYHLQISTIHI